jgi:hypothetical protein
MKYRIEAALVPGHDPVRARRVDAPTTLYYPQWRHSWSPFWHYFKDHAEKPYYGTLVDANQKIKDDMIRRTPVRYIAPELDPQEKVFP